MNCQYCEKPAWSQEYPFCDTHMNMGMGVERKVAEFSSLREVQDFLKKLQEEFTYYHLGAVIPLLSPSFYSYGVDLSISTEESYGKESSISLKMDGKADWGAQSPLTYRCSLNFLWETSSGHTVRIEGEITDIDKDIATFEVFVGTDESEFFYPAVEEVAKWKNPK